MEYPNVEYQVSQSVMSSIYLSLSLRLNSKKAVTNPAYLCNEWRGILKGIILFSAANNDLLL